MAIKVYDETALQQKLDLAALIEFVDQSHRANFGETSDSLAGEERAKYFVRSASSETAFGSKLVTIVPANPSNGLPSVQAIFALFDRKTGICRGILEATGMTYWKTAADSALGSRYLSRPGVDTLLVCGAGSLAPWLVRGHKVARPSLRQVLVWARSPEKAAGLCETLIAEGVYAEPVENLQAGVEAADIISTATLAKEPIIKGGWLKPGQHLDLVGAYQPDAREADDDCLRRGRVFADNRHTALEVGEIILPLQSGALRRDGLLGDLYDLAAGAVGRTGQNDITVFKNAGGAHLDLMTAEFLLRAQT